MRDPERHSSGRVLVVDDEPDLRDLTSRRLRRAGFDVLEAPDGRQAWTIAVDARPELLVLDVRMPGLDGLDLTRRLRDDERTRDAAIVLLTASVEEHEEAAAWRAGADAFLRKPCTSSELLDVVHRLLERDEGDR